MARLIILTITVIIFLQGCASYKQKNQSIGQFDFHKIKKSDSIFYSKYEVTNIQYKSFLKSVMDGDSSNYSELKINNLGWIEEYRFSFNKPMARNYHAHIAFDNYPVVNISFDAALKYCDWLNIIDETEKYYYRLPTQSEFLFLVKTVNIKYDSDNIMDYDQCDFNFNLKFEGNYTIDGGMFTVIANEEVHAYLGRRANMEKYKQNKAGIMHIIGNVSEMLDNANYTGGNWDSLPSEVLSIKKYTKPLPTLGFRIVKVLK